MPVLRISRHQVFARDRHSLWRNVMLQIPKALLEKRITKETLHRSGKRLLKEGRIEKTEKIVR
jgi:hypothetical protein